MSAPVKDELTHWFQHENNKLVPQKIRVNIDEAFAHLKLKNFTSLRKTEVQTKNYLFTAS